MITSAGVVRAPIMNAPDTDVDAAGLAHRFPGSQVWFGAFTRRWWALAKDAHGVWRLLEAASPYGLSHLLESARPTAAKSARDLPEFTDSARPVIPRIASQDRPRGSRKRHGRHERDR